MEYIENFRNMDIADKAGAKQPEEQYILNKKFVNQKNRKDKKTMDLNLLCTKVALNYDSLVEEGKTAEETASNTEDTAEEEQEEEPAVNPDIPFASGYTFEGADSAAAVNAEKTFSTGLCFHRVRMRRLVLLFMCQDLWKALWI